MSERRIPSRRIVNWDAGGQDARGAFQQGSQHGASSARSNSSHARRATDNRVTGSPRADSCALACCCAHTRSPSASASRDSRRCRSIAWAVRSPGRCPVSAMSHQGPGCDSRIGLRVAGSAARARSAGPIRCGGQPPTFVAWAMTGSSRLAVQRAVGAPTPRRKAWQSLASPGRSSIPHWARSAASYPSAPALGDAPSEARVRSSRAASGSPAAGGGTGAKGDGVGGFSVRDSGSGLALLRRGAHQQVPVGEVPPVAAPAFDHHCSDANQLLQRPVDGVLRRLVQPGGQRRASGHPLPGRLSVAQQHRVQPVGAVADLSVDDPLGDDREVLLQDERGLCLATRVGGFANRISHDPPPSKGSATANALITQPPPRRCTSQHEPTRKPLQRRTNRHQVRSRCTAWHGIVRSFNP